MATFSFALLAFHALIGYCGTLPSVEFYQFIAEILKNFKEPLPREPGSKGRFSKIAAGIVGGLVGLFFATQALPDNPVYTLSAAYVGGRLMNSTVILFVNRFLAKANSFSK